MPSKSQAQQKFMGMVHALQKGDIEPSSVSKDVRDAADSMKKSDAKDFASTPHKGLPKKVKQEILNKLKEYANSMGRDHLGGDDYTSSKKGGLRDFDGYDNVDYNKDMPIDEATKGDIMRAVKGKPNPYTLVVIKRGDVIYQKDIKNPQDAPAIYSVIKKHMDKGEKIHIEDRTGKIVFKEGMFSAIDHIRQNSKNVRDFIKNVLSDKQFRDMKSDKDFIKYLGSIYEGKLPNNWMSGRTSDYHTALRGKKRKYDDTNFDKENSGQPDLEEDGMEKSKKNYADWKKTNEATKPDYNSKGFKDASKLVAKLRSSTFRKYNDDELEQFRMVLAQAFDLREYGSRLTEPFLLPNDEDKLKGTPPSKDAIDRVSENEDSGEIDMVLGVLSILRQVEDKENRKRMAIDIIKKFKEDDVEFDYKEFLNLMKEYSAGSYEYTKGDQYGQNSVDEGTMIRRAVDLAQEILPKNTWSRFASDGKKNKEFVKSIVRDLAQLLNKFYKSHDVDVRIKEEVLNEIGLWRIDHYTNSKKGLVPGSFGNVRNEKDKEKKRALEKDLAQTLNGFWKRWSIPFRIDLSKTQR